ncbi:MAG TPA: protein kinase [Anaerolineales bacterium]|nr:protein kinase [Anaerolineales bacterium]
MASPTVNDRYRIDDELGRGGMSIVYRGWDLLLDRPVAVKVLQGARRDSGWKRMLSEAQSVARLNHPNIISIYDVGETIREGQPTPFIVMELVEGRPLNVDPPHELGAIVSVADGVLEALGHAHQHGVIHRDLKPENILLTPDRQVKLMDFGLAQSVASRLTETGEVVGTVFYIAPEQAMGHTVDGRADLYALGVVLYELITGELPFTAENALAVISLHLHAPVVSPRARRPDLPPALESVILRLLAKRPEDRPSTARETRQLLDHALGDRGVGAELSLLDRIVRGHLVGRERELSEAIGHWQRAIAGEEQVLLVTGEPGIGKTRLVHELLAHVEVTGGQVARGECFAEGGAPFAPFAEVVRRALAEPSAPPLPNPILAELVTFAPDLALRFPGLTRTPEQDPAALQQRAFEAFAFLLETLSARAPLAVFIDDIHWADAGSLQLLHYLARRVRRMPLLLVLTYREIEIDENPPLSRLLHDLTRERLAERIKLTRLGREQTRELLEAMFAEDITAEFLEGVYTESEGNPFFIEEICKAILDSGKVAFVDGRWRRPDVADLEIPQSIRGAILSRVEKLPEPAREAMLMAAILGREFDFETLRRATEMPEEGLIGALEAAEHAQLIQEARRNGDVVFSFVHALIPTSLAESVSVLRRRLLHRRAAAAIEDSHPDAWEVLAFHWIEAGEDVQAQVCSLRAADRAYASLARAEAVRHYRAALERWPGNDVAGKAAVLAKLGDCLLLTAGGGTGDVYRQARDLYHALGDSVQVGEMERRLGRLYYEAGDRERSMQHYQEALRILEGLPPTAELAMAYSSMSQMLMLASDHQEAVRWGERALDLARTMEVEAVRVHALNNVGCSLCGLGRTAEGMAMLDESFERAVAAGLAHDAARAKMNVGDVLLVLGRIAEAVAAYEELIAFVAPYHVVGFESSARERLVLTHWLLGEWDVALRIEADLREGGSVGGLTRVWHAATLALIHNDVGLPERSLALLEETHASAMRNEELQTLIPYLTQRARAYRLLGDMASARSTADDMLRRMDAVPFFDGGCQPALLEIVHTLSMLEQPRLGEAKACLERLERMAAQAEIVDAGASIDEVHGLISMLEGDRAQAARSFRQAADLWAELGRPYERARSLARLASARHASGDPRGAQEARREARELIESLRARLADGEFHRAFAGSELVAALLKEGAAG